MAVGLLNPQNDDGRYTIPEVWDKVVLEHEEEVLWGGRMYGLGKAAVFDRP